MHSSSLSLRRLRLRFIAIGLPLAVGVMPGAALSRPLASAIGSANAPAGRTSPLSHLPLVPSFDLTSTSISEGQPLPKAQLSGIYKVPGGKDISPQLSWSGYPAKTKSFVVTFYDPDAPILGGTYQWVVANIPATSIALSADAGAPRSSLLPRGASEITNGLGTKRYVGGAPLPKTGKHVYTFTVSALDVARLPTGRTTDAARIAFALYKHTIARASIECPTSASQAGLG